MAGVIPQEYHVANSYEHLVMLSLGIIIIACKDSLMYNAVCCGQ